MEGIRKNMEGIRKNMEGIRRATSYELRVNKLIS